MKSMAQRAALLLPIVLTLACLPPAHAGEAERQIEAEMGAKVLAKGPSAMPGMTAILAIKDGKKRIFYETADGRHLIYGMIYDAAGINITTLDASVLTGNVKPKPFTGAPVSAPIAQAPAAPVTQVPADNGAASGIEEAMKAYSVTQGSGKPVYVVFDPNCPYCKTLHQKVNALGGKTAVHWIPVGVLSAPGGDSHKKAANFLKAGKPVASLDAISGKTVSAEFMDKASVNVNVLIKSNSDQVPIVFYMNEGRANIIRGLPSDEQINKIFGGK